MIHKLIRKIGAVGITLAVTGIALLSSTCLYLFISLVTDHIQFSGILSSIIIPAIIAPPLAYFFAGTMVKLYRSQESLRQNEEKYRTILDNIEDGYFEVDLNGNFTFYILDLDIAVLVFNKNRLAVGECYFQGSCDCKSIVTFYHRKKSPEK